MKLPRFNDKQYFKDLFSKMNTNYIEYSIGSTWNNSFDDILSILEGKGEIEIPENESLQNYVCDDGYFRVKGKIVLAYIKDQQLSRREKNKQYNTTYKYHLLNCEHLRNFHKKNYIEKYVLRNPNYLGERGDSNFNVNVLDGGDLISKGLQEELLVCKFCLKESNFNNYQNYKGLEKDKFVREFNYKDFFDSEKVKIQDLWSLNLKNEKNSNINSYPPNWRNISRLVRDKNNFRCEVCDLDCSKYKHLLHVHHINGRKDDNRINNLKSLCISCHSKEPGHHFMRNFHQVDVLKCESLKNNPYN